MSAVPKNQEPWLAAARRLDAKLGDLNWANGATYHRRELLAAYDAQATELATLRGQLEKERADFEKAKQLVEDWQKQAEGWRLQAMVKDSAVWAAAEVEGENARLSALLREAQAAAASSDSKFSELWGQVTDLLADFANGCVPVSMGPGVKSTPYWLGVNKERENGRAWAELKCKELGLPWPIPTIPYKGSLPEPPAPACPSTCTGCEKKAAIAEPWCAQCGATEEQVKAPGYRCLQDDSLCNSLIDHPAFPEPAAAGSLPSGGEAEPCSGEIWQEKGSYPNKIRIVRYASENLTVWFSAPHLRGRRNDDLRKLPLAIFLTQYEPEPQPAAAPTTIEKKGGPDEPAL